MLSALARLAKVSNCTLVVIYMCQIHSACVLQTVQTELPIIIVPNI